MTQPKSSSLSGKWMMVAWFAIFFVGDFRFEDRSVLASVQGDASPGVIVEFIAFVAVGVVGLVHLTRGHWRGTRSLGLDLLLVYGLLAVASSLWSSISMFSFVQGLQVVCVGLAAKGTASLWITKRRMLETDWKRIWMALIAAVSLLGVWGLVVGEGLEGRFTWPGVHPLTASGYLGMAAVMAIGLILRAKDTIARRTRGFLAVAAAWCLWLLVLTVSRSTLAATAMSLLLLLGLHAYRSGPKRRWVVFLVVATSSIVLWWFAPVIASYVLRGQSALDFATLTGRTELWGYALGLILDSQLIGYGYGSARLLLTEAFPWAGTGHNLWVEVGVGLGLVGVLVVTAVLTWLIHQSLWLFRLGRTYISMGSFAACALIGIKSIGLETFAVPGVDLALMGLIAAALTTEKHFLRERSRLSTYSRPRGLSMASRA